MAEPRWDSVKRDAVMVEDDRGPDSVECRWDNPRDEHDQCLLDYSDLGPTGFICGCRCHDLEPSASEAAG